MDIIFLTTVVSGHHYSVFRSIGSYQLAWTLRNQGYQVQVIDFIYFYTNDKILTLLSHFITAETRVLALGGIGTHGGGGQEFYQRMVELLQEVRSRWPWIKFIAGGGGAPSILRLFPPKLLDYVVFGHAEQAITELAHHYVRREPPPQSQIHSNGQRIIRADQQPNSWQISGTSHHTWHPSDHIQPGECLPIEHSRGCVFQCRFCSYPLLGKRKNDHLKSLDCLRAQMEENRDRWGTDLYYILDDTFNVDHQRISDFRAMTDSLGFSIGYSAYLRLDLIHRHRHTEEDLRASGLLGAFFGLESLHPEAARLVGKAWNGTQACREYLPQLIHQTWEGKIKPQLSFITGLPPETPEDLELTHEYLVDNDLGHWIWQRLNINRSKNGLTWTSEFERNSEKYGFTWLEGPGWGTWRTDYMDEQRAAELAQDLTNRQPPQRPGGWGYLELLSMGLAREDLEGQDESTLKLDPRTDPGLHRRAFLTRYYWNLLGRSGPDPEREAPKR